MPFMKTLSNNLSTTLTTLSSIIGTTLGSVIFISSAVSAPSFAAEPPTNPYLADSVWPMSHRNPYNQASSPYRGLEPDDEIETDFQSTSFPSITQAYSAPYASTGKSVVWGSTPLAIYKKDLNSNRIKRLGFKLKATSGDPISGAYTIVDSDNKLYVPSANSIVKYGDAIEGDPDSKIAELGSFTIPTELLADPKERIVGINMTYDGYIAAATSHGLVLIVSRDFSEYHTYRLGDGTEEVSNSIAVDEDNDIYVVTSQKMHCINWTGKILTQDAAAGGWSAPYETGSDIPLLGRLGIGSGSTPTLMGTDSDDDRFVVFTDGQELMHLVLMWRDDIPEDWQPIAPSKDIRIAAEFPITFGDPSASKSVSEQSVLVRDYSALVVNNDYNIESRDPRGPEWLPSIATVLVSNLPGVAPYGVEKFTWNTDQDELFSAWANSEISCPNGIPTMSEASNLAYCWGQRNMVWSLEAMDWDTGESSFHHLMGILPRYNSTYAATQVGENQDIISGTFTGLARLQKK